MKVFPIIELEDKAVEVQPEVEEVMT
jgi:hypothetical protein